MRQQLEICIFSSLATEFKTGDACVVGSESYADFRAQLLTQSECEPMLAQYCQQLGFPANAESFVAYLQQELTQVAESVDKICSDGKQFTINKNGEPVLKRVLSLREPTEVEELEAKIRALMPERSILDILAPCRALVELDEAFWSDIGKRTQNQAACRTLYFHNIWLWVQSRSQSNRSSFKECGHISHDFLY